MTRSCQKRPPRVSNAFYRARSLVVFRNPRNRRRAEFSLRRRGRNRLRNFRRDAARRRCDVPVCLRFRFLCTIRERNTVIVNMASADQHQRGAEQRAGRVFQSSGAVVFLGSRLLSVKTWKRVRVSSWTRVHRSGLPRVWNRPHPIRVSVTRGVRGDVLGSREARKRTRARFNPSVVADAAGSPKRSAAVFNTRTRRVVGSGRHTHTVRAAGVVGKRVVIDPTIGHACFRVPPACVWSGTPRVPRLGARF
mmetsp:Transcript_5660/g.21432  ORF Transcript_5660/g.21432 Transcript_5660/m.21432 type:complete len:250 (+) Transcript_5660:2994-3743(+)